MAPRDRHHLLCLRPAVRLRRPDHCDVADDPGRLRPGRPDLRLLRDDRPHAAAGCVRVRDHAGGPAGDRSEEHTSELQSLMRISYAVFCLTKKTNTMINRTHTNLNLVERL